MGTVHNGNIGAEDGDVCSASDLYCTVYGHGAVLVVASEGGEDEGVVRSRTT